MKKNLILAIAGVLAVQISMAQTQKGAQTLGGSFYYAQSTNNNSSINGINPQPNIQKNTTSNFSIGPAYSIFVADKIELGGSLQYSTQTNKSTYSGAFPSPDYKSVFNSFGGSLSLLKYCMFDNKIGLRMGPYLSYSSGKNKATTSANSLTTTNNNEDYNARAKVDLVFYPSKTLGLAASLANVGYSKSKSHNVDNPQQSYSTETFNANLITNGVQLSVFYVFGDK